MRTCEMGAPDKESMPNLHAARGGLRDGLTSEVIAAFIDVHRHLGPGLLESAYERCVCHELSLRRIPFERQRVIAIDYKGVRLACGYRIDLLVAGQLIVEIKAVERLLPVHEAQVLTYMKLTQIAAALLVNFNVPVVKDGLRRLNLKGSQRSP